MASIYAAFSSASTYMVYLPNNSSLPIFFERFTLVKIVNFRSLTSLFPLHSHSFFCLSSHAFGFIFYQSYGIEALWPRTMTSTICYYRSDILVVKGSRKTSVTYYRSQVLDSYLHALFLIVTAA
jgi:hypothetical protein